MRVALVCPYDLTVPGGVQAHVRHLAEALRTAGDEVVIIAPGRVDGPGIVSVGGSVRIPFNDSRAPLAPSPLAARRTVMRLERLHPDVVHVHEPVVPMVSLAAALRGPTPLVGTFHAWSDRDRAYRLARPIARRAADRLAVRIAVSRPAAAYHAAALGLPERAFRIVPNGVDVDRFARASPLPELVAPDPTLLFVGRLERRKGLEDLVRAFVQLKARRPSLRLLVVGEGPERDRCQALLPAALRSSVVFLGQVEPDDLPRFHASADLFVAPSRGGESFGIVLLEAMAAGLPVVATAIPGYAAVVEDGRQGRLVPPGDVGALTGAIGALLDNPSLRSALGRDGAEHARRYDWAVVADEIRDAYVVATRGA